ncbi:hypothetical protein KW791_02390 [Candidatus Parcubacteria bacterium]|nr:hypothetical protein [Candidatus Parcubacteria bacterium]
MEQVPKQSSGEQVIEQTKEERIRSLREMKGDLERSLQTASRRPEDVEQLERVNQTLRELGAE